jgi:hypothetical protein
MPKFYPPVDHEKAPLQYVCSVMFNAQYINLHNHNKRASLVLQKAEKRTNLESDGALTLCGKG